MAAKRPDFSSVLPPISESYTGNHAFRLFLYNFFYCKETGEAKTIPVGFTGTGYFDMHAYMQYNDGAMSDDIPTDADLQVGFDGLPKVE